MSKVRHDSRFYYFNNECAYCGIRLYGGLKNPDAPKPTIDHIVAQSRGGRTVMDNMIPTCQVCNTSKGNEDMELWYSRQDFFDYDRLQKIKNYIHDQKELAQGRRIIINYLEGNGIEFKHRKGQSSVVYKFEISGRCIILTLHKASYTSDDGLVLTPDMKRLTMIDALERFLRQGDK